LLIKTTDYVDYLCQRERW